MKKVVFLFLAVMLFTATGFSQNKPARPNVKYNVPITINTHSEYFGDVVYAGTPIFCVSDSTIYVTQKYDFGPKASLNTVLSNSSYFKAYNYTTWSSHGTTFYLDTATNQTAHGNKGFFGALHAYGTLGVTGTLTGTTGAFTTAVTAPSLTISENKGTSNIAVFMNDRSLPYDSIIVCTKSGQLGIGQSTVDPTYMLYCAGNTGIGGNLTMVGNTSLVLATHSIGKTTGNGNSITTHSSLVVATGDTITADVGSITNLGAYYLGINGAITGSTPNRGVTQFTTSLTRKAIFISGVTASDIFVVSPWADDSHTRPVAGDALNWYAVTDSLIVMRAAGTTSALHISYIRFK
jgi:hypothetical protein